MLGMGKAACRKSEIHKVRLILAEECHMDSVYCIARYVVFHQTSLEKSLRAAMPNLVMVVETGCVIRNDHICVLKVYRPVSYTTVLAVLEVPVKHQGSQYFHEYCAQWYSRRPDYEYDPDKLPPDCAAIDALFRHKWEPKYGYSRTVDVITKVDLYDTGVIHGNSPARHQKVSSNVLLPGARIERPEDCSDSTADDRGGQYVTAMQLLKMSVVPSQPSLSRYLARPSRSGNVVRPSRFVEKETMSIKVRNRECVYKPKYHPWHLSFTLREDEVDDFLHQVCSP